MADKTHWENIYLTKNSRQVSWYQEHAELSIRFIQETGVGKSAQIIDVGGGSSTLVDDLLAAGLENVTVLDISGAALRCAQDRLGVLASTVKWVEADITQADLLPSFYDVWHDRAAFHFLTRADDRHRYVQSVKRSVKTGGHVIVASFGPEGPERCSGLEVVRYSPETMHDEFGDDFELVDSTTQIHQTPTGTDQQFIYCNFRKAQSGRLTSCYIEPPGQRLLRSSSAVAPPAELGAQPAKWSTSMSKVTPSRSMCGTPTNSAHHRGPTVAPNAVLEVQLGCQ